MLDQTIELPFLQNRLKGVEVCPYCGSTDLYGDEVDTGSGEACQPMGCGDCNLSWVDGYKIDTCLVTELPDED